MLNRWLAGKQAEERGERQRRPYLASECHDLNEADKWRQQILREVGKKVMEIQNAGLGEHRCGGGAWVGAGGVVPAPLPCRTCCASARSAAALPACAPTAALTGCLPGLSHPVAARRIRDLNDEINKLIREKGHWERRIVELGGPDYSKVGGRRLGCGVCAARGVVVPAPPAAGLAGWSAEPSRRAAAPAPLGPPPTPTHPAPARRRSAPR